MSDSSDVDLVVSSTTIVVGVAVVGVHPCSNATAPLPTGRRGSVAGVDAFRDFYC